MQELLLASCKLGALGADEPEDGGIGGHARLVWKDAGSRAKPLPMELEALGTCKGPKEHHLGRLQSSSLPAQRLLGLLLSLEGLDTPQDFLAFNCWWREVHVPVHLQGRAVSATVQHWQSALC